MSKPGLIVSALYLLTLVGSRGVASADNANIDRRERLRKLALETIDLAKDPYFMKNHLGLTSPYQ